jgi:pimeloyl-ACP methyl ester carboxylesterase
MAGDRAVAHPDIEGRDGMSHPSPFKTPQGEARFRAAYDAALKLWPVPYEELDLATRFGPTHVVAAGPKNAPPLVLLHGYMATSVMWGLNIADFSEHYRVYAIDTMGQPGKSLPTEPIRDAADYVAWLTATFDALHLDRASVVGMSYGGWLALRFAVAAPERVSRLVLLSPGGLLPLVRQFRLRGMLMTFVPTRVTVNSFMHWVGFTGAPGGVDATPVLDLMYLGLKYFRIPPDTLRAAAEAANPLSDGDLRAVHAPVLLLIGDGEVLYDAPTALARARRLIPDVEGDLIPRCRHDMCVSQSRIVDARVLDFLRRTDDRHAETKQRSVA